MAVIAVVATAYYLARFMKGKLTVTLSQDSANTDELITGQVTLLAKKRIHGLLNISLVGKEERSKGTGDDRRYEWVEVYRYDHVLEQKRMFDAGTEHQYNFDLLAPKPAEVNSAATELKKWTEKSSHGLVGKLKTKVATKMAEHEASGSLPDTVQWHVESRLDADGIDLFTVQPCKINLKA
ncbi:MAG: hypothetical protein AB8C95_03090 [Phycisphaeraceae bacterium]